MNCGNVVCVIEYSLEHGPVTVTVIVTLSTAAVVTIVVDQPLPALELARRTIDDAETDGSLNEKTTVESPVRHVRGLPIVIGTVYGRPATIG